MRRQSDTWKRRIQAESLEERDEVVDNIKAQMLKGMSKKSYDALLKSGMFFELYPSASGVYEQDVQ